jgi:hypothetical protein
MSDKKQDINSPDNIAAMRFVKDKIEKAVLPYRERIEAAVVAGACLQVAKVLLDLYPEETRKALIEGACLLLEGYAGEEPAIIIPKWPEFQTIDAKDLKKH